MLHAGEDTAKVGGHHGVETFEIQIAQRSEAAEDAGIVPGEMQTAKSRDGPCHQRLHLLLVRDIRGDCQRRPALAHDCVRDRLQFGHPPPRDHDVGALATQTEGRSLAHARPSARDDDGTMAEAPWQFRHAASSQVRPAMILICQSALINVDPIHTLRTRCEELDDLKSMAVFVQIVDRGSLSAAAEREGMSPTMAGNHLRALERKLGATLLKRTTRRHALTEAGRGYYEKARAILQLVAEAHAGAEAIQAAPRGRLRVAAPVSFGAERLSPALEDLLARYPDIVVDLALSDRVVDLIDDGFDAAIRIGRLADSSLIARPLQDYRMWICASPSYLAARGVPTRPNELEHHACLVFSYAGREWRFSASDPALRVKVDGRIEANSGQALRMAARAGLGIIMQPEVLLAEDVADGRLVRLFGDFDLPSRPMNLVYLRDRHMTPKLRGFIDFVTDRFG